MISLIQGDCLQKLKELPEKTFQTCVTSPPYWGLRDYGMRDQIGLEQTPEQYVENMVQVFREVKRTLKDDGTLWLNMGDSYIGGGRGGHSDSITGRGKDSSKIHFKPEVLLKPKDLVGIPWRIAFALQTDGWFLRQDIIWHKPNPMPESVRDRCTKAHEYIFLLSKCPKYYFDTDAIREPFKTTNKGQTKNRNGTPYVAQKNERTNSGGFEKKHNGRNKRSVWTVTTKSFKGAHFATFPQDLIEPCILAGSRENDTVLDPFNGAGTTGVVAKKHNRNYVGIELNPEYLEITKSRLGA